LQHSHLSRKIGPIQRLSVAVAVNGSVIPGASGTAGAIVQDPNGVRHLLSCNHVLYLNGAVLRGRDSASVVSPAGKGSRAVAVVREIPAFCRLTTSANNAGDFAVAELTAPDFRTHTRGMPKLRWQRPIPASTAVGRRVWKAGAATGVTSGVVKSSEYGVSLWFDSMNARFRFARQLLIGSEEGAAFSDAGDSGALLVTEDGAGVAMVCAQTSHGTVASPLAGLFESLDLHFVLEG
jgi:hypothetical protein